MTLFNEWCMRIAHIRLGMIEIYYDLNKWEETLANIQTNCVQKFKYLHKNKIQKVEYIHDPFDNSPFDKLIVLI